MASSVAETVFYEPKVRRPNCHFLVEQILGLSFRLVALALLVASAFDFVVVAAAANPVTHSLSRSLHWLVLKNYGIRLIIPLPTCSVVVV